MRAGFYLAKQDRVVAVLSLDMEEQYAVKLFELNRKKMVLIQLLPLSPKSMQPAKSSPRKIMGRSW